MSQQFQALYPASPPSMTDIPMRITAGQTHGNTQETVLCVHLLYIQNKPILTVRLSSGRNRTRTCDPIDVNDVLYPCGRFVRQNTSLAPAKPLRHRHFQPFGMTPVYSIYVKNILSTTPFTSMGSVFIFYHLNVAKSLDTSMFSGFSWLVPFVSFSDLSNIPNTWVEIRIFTLISAGFAACSLFVDYSIFIWVFTFLPEHRVHFGLEHRVHPF